VEIGTALKQLYVIAQNNARESSPLFSVKSPIPE
jgi:hypothetical protein